MKNSSIDRPAAADWGCNIEQVAVSKQVLGCAAPLVRTSRLGQHSRLKPDQQAELSYSIAVAYLTMYIGIPRKLIKLNRVSSIISDPSGLMSASAPIRSDNSIMLR